MKLSELSKILGEAFLAFPNLALTEGMIAAWYKICHQIPAKVFDAGLTESIRKKDNGFFPTPGEVVSICRQLESPPESAELWEEAWNVGLKNFNADDSNLSERGRECWRIMPDSKNRRLWMADQIPFLKNHFKQIWESVTERKEKQQQLHRAELDWHMAEAMPMSGTEKKLLKICAK